MSKLWKTSKTYINQSTAWDSALLKCFICAAGVLVGLCIPKKKKAKAGALAAGLLSATAIPLLGKYQRIARELAGEEEDE